MNRVIKILIMSAVIIVIQTAIIYGKTTINQAGVVDVTNSGFSDMEKLIQNTSDFLGPGISNAFAMANIGGYPVGSAYLGSFPSLFVGVYASAGLTNMEYFDKTKDLPDGRYPGAGINTGAYFGLGMGKGIDIMGRLMTYSTGMYNPPYNNKMVSLEKMNLYAAGGKIRYNMVGKKTILPGLFDFGGVTVGLGGDFLKGYIKVGGAMEYPMDSIEANIGGIPTSIKLNFKSEYSAEVSWYVISGNSQITAYFDFLWLFDFYTGLGLTMNYGKFNLKLKGNGTLSTTDSNYLLFNPTGDLGTLTLTSSNGYRSDIYIPVYIVGFDIRLIVICITFESMVNLRNKKDINLQFGARLQF